MIKDKFEKNKKTVYARSPFASGILNSRFNVNKNFSIGDQRKKWLIKDRLINVYNQKKRLKKCDDKIENYALKFALNAFYRKLLLELRKSQVDFIFKNHLNKN